MINDKVIEELTGCRRVELRVERLKDGSYPGKILTRSGNEVLCEEEQSYINGAKTGNNLDYVLVLLLAEHQCQACLDYHDGTTKARQFKGVKLDTYCDSCFWIEDGVLFGRLTAFDSDRLEKVLTKLKG